MNCCNFFTSKDILLERLPYFETRCYSPLDGGKSSRGMCLDCKMLLYDTLIRERNWSIWNQVQTKKKNRLSMKWMEQLVIVQTNLWIIENLGAQMPLKQVNIDSIHITKIPTTPMWDEEKKYHCDNIWQQVERHYQRKHKLAHAIPFSKLEIITRIFQALKMSP